jgi:hypothetical protein
VVFFHEKYGTMYFVNVAEIKYLSLAGLRSGSPSRGEAGRRYMSRCLSCRRRTSEAVYPSRWRRNPSFSSVRS